MLFNSAQFLIFFPIVAILYYVIPKKVRYIWLFLCSYYFYMCWNVRYGLLLFGTTLLTYFSARLLDGNNSLFKKNISLKARKYILTATVIACLLLLAVFKYSFFITKTLADVLHALRLNAEVPMFSLVIPVGISFYLFQSLGYVIDVYKGKVSAEKNFILYATFISFFPQLVAGPIERADKLLPQFKEEHAFNYSKVKNSLLLMLWGFFMKIVIADRIAIYVDAVFNNYEIYGGCLLLVATIFFAFQIYCDFAGYSLIAKGAAGVMGFELMDNFNAPYCATGVREFWAKWHISLTGWFREYVYFSLGGSRKGKLRKQINTLIVFLLSGLWHGPSWSFVLWGFLNGFYIVMEDVLKELVKKSKHLSKIVLPKFIRTITGTVVTFTLVDFAWIFFRAPGLKSALSIIRSILTFSNAKAFFDNTVNYQILNNKNMIMILLGIAVLLFVDICHTKGFHFREFIEKQKTALRWLFYWLLLMSVLIFGIWGPGFNASAFIYFQF